MSVIKVSTTKVVAVEISAFVQSIYKQALATQRAAQTHAQHMRALLIAQYGQPKAASVPDDHKHGPDGRFNGGPTIKQYTADMAGLRQLAKARGLVDDQHVRKPYAAAVKALYGALPISMDAAAVAKRAERERNDRILKDALAKAALGAPVQPKEPQPNDRQPTEQEQVESLVTRIGVFEVAYAAIRILAADKTTEAQALHMRKQLDVAKDAHQKAEAAARLTAIKPTEPVKA